MVAAHHSNGSGKKREITVMVQTLPQYALHIYSSLNKSSRKNRGYT